MKRHKKAEQGKRKVEEGTNGSREEQGKPQKKNKNSNTYRQIILGSNKSIWALSGIAIDPKLLSQWKN